MQRCVPFTIWSTMRNSFFLNCLSSLWQSLSNGVDVEASVPTARQGGIPGPAVNVDGMPMLDACVDVLGRPYGDTGSAFHHEAGCLGGDAWHGLDH